MTDIKHYIKTIPDFPKPGIMFRDVTSLMADPQGFSLVIDLFARHYHTAGIEVIAGLEARGFIFGAALAHRMSLGFVPIRKKGKLPGQTIEQAYELEYGTAIIEMHKDAVSAGQRVLLIDDLLATGGTALAGVSLLRRLEADVVSCGFVVDLPDLGGHNRLRETGVDVHILCAFEGE